MSTRKNKTARRPRAARNVHRARGGGARRLELQGLRGSSLDLLRERDGWRKKISTDLVYRIAQEELINDHLSFLEKFVETGKLPDDWARDFANVEWFLCDYPIQFANIPLGLMEADRALAYRTHDPETRPPIVFDFNNKIIQGRHRLIGAFLRGETSILAYIPQRIGTTNPIVARYRVGFRETAPHGRWTTPTASRETGPHWHWTPPTAWEASTTWTPPKIKTL